MKILVGIPSLREDERFIDSICKFKKEVKHDLEFFYVKDKLLVDAQNIIAEKFVSGDYDYLLFLDDDQWGHVPEMLDCLIDANADMATMKTYSRHYPYSCSLMKIIYGKVLRYAGLEEGIGYEECDLTGFPMTLLSRKLFNKIGRPFFREKTDGIRSWATDEEFCIRLSLLGIKPVGCFQYCLNHGDVTKENVFQKRINEMRENNNIAFLLGFKERQNLLKGV